MTTNGTSHDPTTPPDPNPTHRPGPLEPVRIMPGDLVRLGLIPERGIDPDRSPDDPLDHDVCPSLGAAAPGSQIHRSTRPGGSRRALGSAEPEPTGREARRTPSRRPVVQVTIDLDGFRAVDDLQAADPEPR